MIYKASIPSEMFKWYRLFLQMERIGDFCFLRRELTGSN